MKTYYSLLLAAIASGALAHGAAATAYTTPVGYVTLDVPAESDAVVGPCLNRASVFEGIATTAAGSTITLKATGMTAGQFQYNSPTQTEHYYLQFRTGSLAGQHVEITTNAATNNNGTPSDTSDDTTDFTLSESVSITGTPTVAVVPFWTLDKLFPSGAGVGTQDDPGSTNQNVMFFDDSSVGVNLGTVATETFSYYDGSQGGDAGWYGVNTGLPAGDTVIDPGQLMLIRNVSEVARQVVVTGEVPRESIASPVYRENEFQDNANVIRYPIDVPLASSGLCTATETSPGVYTFSGPVSPVDDPGSTSGDSVLVFDYNPADEDGTPVVSGFNFNAEKTYVFYDGSQGGTPEWYNVNSGSPENPLLKAGRGLFIRKADGSVTALSWVQPIPYTP